METQVYEEEAGTEAATPKEMITMPLGEKLLRDERRAIKYVIEKFGLGHSSAQWTGFTNDDDFIKAAMHSHADLIKRWGGWRYHSPPMTIEELDEEAAHEITTRVQMMTSDLPLALRQELANGTLPMPTILPVMRRRYAVTMPGVKTTTVHLGGGHSVHVRNGQAIGRVVLSHIKTKFGDKPEYLRIWNRMFELLGHGWRTAEPFAVTLSAAPSTFLRLGQMGENSCTRFGSDWAKGKKFQALLPNSVVAMIYRGNDAVEKETKHGRGRVGKPVYRGWGIVQPGEWAILSNHYLLPIATAAPMLAKVLVDAVGLPVEPGYTIAKKEFPGYKPLHTFSQGPGIPSLYYCNGDDTVFGGVPGSNVEQFAGPSIQSTIQTHYQTLYKTKMNVLYEMPDWLKEETVEVPKKETAKK